MVRDRRVPDFFISAIQVGTHHSAQVTGDEPVIYLIGERT